MTRQTRRNAVYLAGVIAVLITPATAEDYTSSLHFQDSCQKLVRLDPQNSSVSSDNALAAGECLGFATGASQALGAFQILSKNTGSICLPLQNGSNIEYVKVWLKYLDNHPEELHLPAFVSFAAAQHEAFPCANN